MQRKASSHCSEREADGLVGCVEQRDDEFVGKVDVATTIRDRHHDQPWNLHRTRVVEADLLPDGVAGRKPEQSRTPPDAQEFAEALC